MDALDALAREERDGSCSRRAALILASTPAWAQDAPRPIRTRVR